MVTRTSVGATDNALALPALSDMAKPAAAAIKNFEFMGSHPALSGYQKTPRDFHYRNYITSRNTRGVKDIGEQRDRERQPFFGPDRPETGIFRRFG